jgi:hypothetical protein
MSIKSGLVGSSEGGPAGSPVTTLREPPKRVPVLCRARATSLEAEL